MTQLRNYLRNDKPGLKLLDSISRYLGELRQQKSAASDSIARLQSQSDTHNAASKSAKEEADVIGGNLNNVKSELLQARYDLSQLRGMVTDLEQELEPDDVEFGDVPERFQNHAAECARLFKEMRQRIRKAPAPVSMETIRMFDVCDIVRSSSRDDLYTLGSFVFLCSATHFHAGFKMKIPPGDESKIGTSLHGSDKEKFMRWIEDWVEHSALENDIRWKTDLLQYSSEDPTASKKVSTKCQKK